MLMQHVLQLSQLCLSLRQMPENILLTSVCYQCTITIVTVFTATYQRHHWCPVTHSHHNYLSTSSQLLINIITAVINIITAVLLLTVITATYQRHHSYLSTSSLLLSTSSLLFCYKFSWQHSADSGAAVTDWRNGGRNEEGGQRTTDRVKWRHISMVAIRSPFCRSTPSYCT